MITRCSRFIVIVVKLFSLWTDLSSIRGSPHLVKAKIQRWIRIYGLGIYVTSSRNALKLAWDMWPQTIIQFNNLFIESRRFTWRLTSQVRSVSRYSAGCLDHPFPTSLWETSSSWVLNQHWLRDVVILLGSTQFPVPFSSPLCPPHVMPRRYTINFLTTYERIILLSFTFKFSSRAFIN